jgi:hypothetical protein
VLLGFTSRYVPISLGYGNPSWCVKPLNNFDCVIAAVIRDTLFIDGGDQWWIPGMADGTFGDPVNDGMTSNRFLRTPSYRFRQSSWSRISS